MTKLLTIAFLILTYTKHIHGAEKESFDEIKTKGKNIASHVREQSNATFSIAKNSHKSSSGANFPISLWTNSSKAVSCNGDNCATLGGTCCNYISSNGACCFESCIPNNVICCVQVDGIDYPCPLYTTCVCNGYYNRLCVPISECQGCNFYQCLENVTNCGSSGYPLSFGKYFCNRFIEFQSDFDAAGQVFLSKVRPCLIQKLWDRYVNLANNYQCYGYDNDCKELENYAFDTHIPCFINSGFCEVCKTNKLAFFKVLNYGFNAVNLHGVAWKQYLGLMKQCLPKYECSSMLSFIGNHISTASVATKLNHLLALIAIILAYMRYTI